MYVYDVTSTVTKHSDYFVWKDKSERVTWRFNNTVAVDKKRVKSCVLKHLFWREISNQQIAKNTRKCFLRRCTIVTFSKKSRLRFPHGYWELHFAHFW